MAYFILFQIYINIFKNIYENAQFQISGIPAPETGAGSVLDYLWKRYAIEYIKTTHSNSAKDGNGLLVYSIGPCMSKVERFFDQPLLPVLSGLRSPDESAFGFGEMAFEFEFKSENQDPISDVFAALVSSDFASPAAGAAAAISTDIDGDVCFFTILCTNAGMKRGPPLASKVPLGDVLVVSKLRIGMLDPRENVVHLDLGKSDPDDLVLLTPQSLSHSELCTLRRWTPVKLQFDFGSIVMLRDDTDVVHEVLSGLLRAQASFSLVPEYVVSPDDPRAECRMQVLEQLEGCGLAESKDGAKQSWSFTEYGVTSLSAMHKLAGGDAVLSIPPVSGSIDDLSVFELWEALARAGWRGQVHAKAAGKRWTKPKPYEHGGDKVWFVRANQHTVFSSYLRALLVADTRKFIVTHFQTASSYQALLDGREVRKRKKRTKFEFESATAASDAADANAAIADALTPPAPASDAADAAIAESSASDAADAADGIDDGMTDGGDSIPSFPSINSDAEEEKDMLALDGPVAGPVVGGAGSSSSGAGPAGPTAGAAAAAEDLPPFPRGQHQWRGYRWTPIYVRQSADQIGWEVQCKEPGHVHIDVSCRRRRVFRAHGGPEMLERKLKAWCCHGLLMVGDNGPLHRNIEFLSDTEVPSLRVLETIDERTLPPWKLQARALSAAADAPGAKRPMS